MLEIEKQKKTNKHTKKNKKHTCSRPLLPHEMSSCCNVITQFPNKKKILADIQRMSALPYPYFLLLGLSRIPNRQKGNKMLLIDGNI